jgi:flagellar M-ring protein FliF
MNTQGLSNLGQRISEFWRGLNPLARSLLIGVPALLLVAGIALIGIGLNAPPRQAILFRDLETADAAAIVAELKKQGADYRLENEGHDILVPADKVYDLRLAMAGEGLPRGNAGFELFDKQRFGVTETGMQIDYQRALQGELASTLESLGPVESASVLLNIAPQTSFLDSDARSTASVTLHLRGNGVLSPAQVQGVQHLVSCAVSRLAPGDVTVVDGNGSPLSSDPGEGGTALAGLNAAEKQRQVRKGVERDMEEKIRRMLEGPYGTRNLAVSVAAEIDFATMSRQSENYTPVIDDKGIEKSISEKRDKSLNNGAAPGGVPGTTSNIPGYLGIEGTGEVSRSEQSKYDLNIDYLVNKEVRMEDLPPGAVKRLSAAVAISTENWDEKTKTAVEQLVASAIGADTARGDVINAQAFQFMDDGESAMAAELHVQRTAATVNRVIGWVAALLMVGLVMFMLRGLVTRNLPQEGLAYAGAGAGGSPAGGAEEDWELPEEIRLRGLDTAGATSGQKMREEIAKLIDRNPQQVASLLRSWMLED